MALRNQEIGARLRELRGQKPQTTVADELGVSERAYQGWEGGEAKPSYRNLQRLAAYFNVGEDFILTGERRGSVPPASGTPVLAARRESGEDRIARMEQEITGLIAAVSDVISEAREVIDDFKTYRSEIGGQLTGQTDILRRIEARLGADEAVRDELADLIQRRGREIVHGAPPAEPPGPERDPERSSGEATSPGASLHSR